MRPDLSIVIPSYNRSDLLRACLATVIQNAPAQTEILVVDDASPDHLASRVAAEFHEVRALRLTKQSGFCVAANTGIKAAAAPIVELLNDDTEVAAGWVEPALAQFESRAIGAVAPLVLRWPGGGIGEARIDSAGDHYFIGGFARKRECGALLQPRHLSARKVMSASASSAFYRRDAVVRVGGFPESFGAYFEDVDLSLRLQRAGFDIVYEPASRILHHVSASHGRTSPALLAQQSRNEERVFWRNVSRTIWFHALPAHVAVLIGKAFLRMREGNLGPFLHGRMQAFREIRELLRQRYSADAKGVLET